MLEELKTEMRERHLKAYKGKKMHQLWPDYMRDYINNLVQLASLPPIKPVLLDIYDESRALSYKDMKNYRNYRYKIIDDRMYLKEIDII